MKRENKTRGEGWPGIVTGLAGIIYGDEEGKSLPNFHMYMLKIASMKASTKHLPGGLSSLF